MCSSDLPLTHVGLNIHGEAQGDDEGPYQEETEARPANPPAARSSWEGHVVPLVYPARASAAERDSTGHEKRRELIAPVPDHASRSIAQLGVAHSGLMYCARGTLSLDCC